MSSREIKSGEGAAGRPLLITGANGALGEALVRACEARNLPFVALGGRRECDIADPEAVERALARYQPWAVANAAGYVSVVGAEAEEFDCFRANVKGPAVLARACARRGLKLMVFSSAMVFDGGKAPEPYVESDAVHPLGVYARSKARMEQVARREMPNVLIVRSSALFGPWDSASFLTRALGSISRGNVVWAASDEFLTPAYLPEFAPHVLGLLMAGETGVWHVGQGDPSADAAPYAPVSRAEIIRRAAEMAGLRDAPRLLRLTPLAEIAASSAPCCLRWAVLATERGGASALPPLDTSLRDYVAQWASLRPAGPLPRDILSGVPSSPLWAEARAAGPVKVR